MKRKFPAPLKVDCSDLSPELFADFVDDMNSYFFNVERVGKTVYLSNAVNIFRYSIAWRRIDSLNVKWH